jgi:hypothetical protein
LGNRVNDAAYTSTATLTNRTGNNISRKKRIDALVLFHSRNRSEVVMQITGAITLVFRYVAFFSASMAGDSFFEVDIVSLVERVGFLF